MLAAEAEGIGVGFGNVEGFGEEFGEAVDFLDCGAEGIAPLAVGVCQENHFELAADGGHGAAEVVGERVGDGMELVYGFLDAVEHAVNGAGEAGDFVVSVNLGDSAFEVVLADAGGDVGDGLDTGEGAAAGDEDEDEAEQDDGCAGGEEVDAHASEEEAVVVLREAEVDGVASLGFVSDDAEGDGSADDGDVARDAGTDGGSANGGEVVAAVALADPEFEAVVGAEFEEEDGIVGVLGVLGFGRDFLGGEFGDFVNDAVVEDALWGALGYVAEDFDLAEEPCVGSALDFVGDEAMEEEEGDDGADGEDKRAPAGDAPGGGDAAAAICRGGHSRLPGWCG